MSSVAVLIPWAGFCPHRLAALRYVRTWYDRNFPAWDVVLGMSKEGGQWCKAEAIGDALRQTSSDILVVADADVVANDVGQAVQEVQDGGSWAVPHTKLHRLDEYATREVLRGVEPSLLAEKRTNLTQAPYTGYPGGGVTVLRREVYESAPLDPRFLGWGQEDESWALALTLLHGKPWRAPGPMWHLWHPPQMRMSRTTGSYASRDLLQQYRRIHTRSGMERQLRPARSFLSRASDPVQQTV